MRVLVEKPDAVEAGYLDRFQWSETGFNQKLDFTQIAKPRYDAAVAGWVQPGYQQTAEFECGIFIFGISRTLYFMRHRATPSDCARRSKAVCERRLTELGVLAPSPVAFVSRR
jgi:hypothetical protein